MGQIPTVRENRERTFPNETYVKNSVMTCIFPRCSHKRYRCISVDESFVLSHLFHIYHLFLSFHFIHVLSILHIRWRHLSCHRLYRYFPCSFIIHRIFSSDHRLGSFIPWIFLSRYTIYSRAFSINKWKTWDIVVTNRKGEIHTHMTRWKRTQGRYPASVNTHPPIELDYDSVPQNSFSVCLRRTGIQNFFIHAMIQRTLSQTYGVLCEFSFTGSSVTFWKAQFIFTWENPSKRLLILPNFSESLQIT